MVCSMGVMDVLHVSNYPPRNEGISIYLGELVEKMREIDEDIKHSIIGFKESRGENVDPVFDIDEPKSFLEGFRKIKNSDADIVLLQHELNLYGRKNFLILGFLLYFWKIFSSQEKKIVTSIHTHIQYPLGFKPKVFLKWLGYRKITYGLIERFSSKVVLFDKHADKVTNIRNSEFIPLGAEVPENPEGIREKFGVSEDKTMIGCAGFLHDNKNFHTIIRAMKNLPEKYHLVINGSTHPDHDDNEEYFEELQHIVKNEDLENQVTLNMEYLSEEDMNNFFHSSDLTIIAYENNNQSGNMYRAIANECKIVCTDKENYRDMLGEKGSYFWPITPENIAESVEQSENISGLGSLKSDYSMDTAAKKHIDLFQNLKN